MRVGRIFFFLSRNFKTRANRREFSSGLCATNSFTGRSYFNSTSFTFTFESFIFGKYMRKKKRKKLWQYPAIFSSRLANNAYLLNYFKGAHNVVQAFLSLRAFKPFKFCFYCTKFMQMIKKKQKTICTDKFDPMRDKNDLKERLGQKRDKTTHSKSLILKFLSRQSEFTKMRII